MSRIGTDVTLAERYRFACRRIASGGMDKGGDGGKGKVGADEKGSDH